MATVITGGDPNVNSIGILDRATSDDGNKVFKKGAT